jgi:hypothetical protein
MLVSGFLIQQMRSDLLVRSPFDIAKLTREFPSKDVSRLFGIKCRGYIPDPPQYLFQTSGSLSYHL